jgi:hypothetical protein
MSLEPLWPGPGTWRLATTAPERDRLVLHMEPIRHVVACPVCGTQSRRVHSRYHRNPWGVPWNRWPVQLIAHSRASFAMSRPVPTGFLSSPSQLS